MDEYVDKRKRVEEFIECACGCGTQIPSRDKLNRPRRYVKGHASRAPSHHLHSPEAQERSREGVRRFHEKLRAAGDRLCVDCQKEKPIDAFYYGNRWRGYRCVDCGRERNRLKTAQNRDKAYASKLQRKFGFSREKAMSIAKHPACDICGSPRGDRSLAQDHNHDTGATRGILCSKCNMALGLVGESVETLTAMIMYLNHWR